MPSVVQICNIALTRIGQNQLIASLSEQSLAAQLCSLHYEACRDELLRDFPWPFATRRVTLADIGSPPDGWAYRYRYPVDCIRAQHVSQPGVRQPTSAQRVPFAVAYAEGGRAILCDQSPAELVYSARVEDTTYFDPLFVSALAWRLAAELATGLQGNASNYAAAYQQYRMVVDMAQANAFEESEEGVPPESEFITGRN